MAEVNPTQDRGIAKQALRDMLAESATFQAAIGATGTPAEKLAAAKLRLHRTAYTPSGEFERPFGLITSCGNDKNPSNAVYQFSAAGDIELRLERAIPEQYLHADEPDFVVTGEIDHSPDGEYYEAGIYADKPYYQQKDGIWKLSWNESNSLWCLAGELGEVVAGWALEATDPPGIYVPGPFVEGTATVLTAGGCENAEVDFENFYEGVMADAMVLSVNPGYLAINSWDIIEGPFRYEEPIYGVRILVNWGLT